MRFYWLEFCPSLSASRLDILSDLNGLERKQAENWGRRSRSVVAPVLRSQESQQHLCQLEAHRNLFSKL
jgi:hypothetical protein